MKSKYYDYIKIKHNLINLHLLLYFTIAQSICNGLLANQLKLHLESHKNGGKYFFFNFPTIVLYWRFKKIYLEYSIQP